MGFLLTMLFLCAVVPFNIAYHLTDEYAYVDGCLVNYLEIVVHIVDIGVLAFTAWAYVWGKVYVDRKALVAAYLIAFFLSLHGVLFRNPTVWYSAARLMLYGFCFTAVLGGSGVVLDGEPVCIFSMLKKRKMNRILGSLRQWLGAMSPFDLFVLVIAVLAVVQSVIGVLQFVGNDTLGLGMIGESDVAAGGANTGAVYLPGGLRLRAYGTFPHPNVLGGFLSLALIFVLFSIRFFKGHTRRILIGSVFAVVAGIVVTWSRVAWASAVITFGLWIGWMVWKSRRKYMTHFIMSILAGGLLAVLWVWSGNDAVSSAVRERFIGQSVSSDVSIVQRQELAERAVVMIAEHPVTGVGAGKFIPQLSDIPVYTDSGISVMQPVHNVILLILAEMGFAGLLCFGSFFVIVGMHSVLVRWSVPGAALAVLFLSAAMLDHYLWTLPQGLALWILAGLWYRSYTSRVL